MCFLSQLLGPTDRFYLGVDINSLAAEASLLTMRSNHARPSTSDFVVDDMLASLRSRLAGGIDLLLFNPPYVPTPSAEVGSRGIEAAWAGGVAGREVIDVFVPLVPGLLSERGQLFMVLVQENRPDELVAQLHVLGLHAELVSAREAGIEDLCVLRARRA